MSAELSGTALVMLGDAPDGPSGAASDTDPHPHLELALAATGYPTVLRTGPTAPAAVGGPREPADLAVVVERSGPGGGDPGEVAVTVSALVRVGWRHVVVIGADVRAGTVVQVLAAGARAFLVAGAGADRPPEPAVAAPPNAATLQPDATARPAARLTDVEGRACTLSTREVEVLALAAEGLANADIGRELGLSALTVKSHLSRMTRRLGAGDRAHLVLLALRAGVLR